MIEALEYQFDEMIATERVHVQRRPKDYFRDHIFACFWFEGKSAANAIEYFDGNNLMFETDFPHPTCLYPEGLTKAAEGLKDVKPAPPEESDGRTTLSVSTASSSSARIPQCS